MAFKDQENPKQLDQWLIEPVEDLFRKNSKQNEICTGIGGLLYEIGKVKLVLWRGW